MSIKLSHVYVDEASAAGLLDQSLSGGSLSGQVQDAQQGIDEAARREYQSERARGA